MVQGFVSDLVQKVSSIYCEIDSAIVHFQATTGLHCPDRCGICCESPNVEATVLECLPVACAIYFHGREDLVAIDIAKALSRGHLQCVLYEPDTGAVGKGRCSFYPDRPLMCRLFGYCARRNKTDGLDLFLCRIIREAPGNSVRSLELEGVPAPALPIGQNMFIHIASLRPDMGYQYYTINTALQKAVEYLYLHHPRHTIFKKVV